MDTLKPHELDKSLILSRLKTRVTGLSAQNALQRHKLNGANELPSDHDTWLDVLLRQCRSPLLLILGVAAVISYNVGQHTSAITIAAMMLLSILLGFINEYRSAQVLLHLQRHLKPITAVLRDNILVEIETRNVVVGDIVPLLPGVIIPADMRLIDAENLEINESVLSGESMPHVKHVEKIRSSSGHIHGNCAYFGTFVTGGHGLGVVCAIGSNTEYGTLARTVSTLRPEGEFAVGIRSFGMLLTQVVAVIAVIIFSANAFLGKPLIDSLLFTLAIAIGLTPELLPAVVSVSMAHGASRLAKKHVVVKRLVAIEDLGNIDVLCTDKTGTLTEGILRVSQYYSVTQDLTPELLECAIISAEKARAHHTSTSAFDTALQELRKQTHLATKRYHYIAALPFDFNRKRLSKLVRIADKSLLVVRGAPEAILESCTHIRIHNKIERLTEHWRTVINDDFHQKSALGLRVLGFAQKPLSRKTISLDDESDLIYEGTVVFEDPIKPSVKSAVGLLQKNQVRLCVISGDSELVCHYVCKGLIDTRAFLTGDKIDRLTDAQLERACKKVQMFARVTPEQKVRIIRSFKQLHKSVAFLGDGVNDAPALHEADVGISVAGAVDIAKDASNVLLLKQDLGVLADGIEEGRRIFTNTIKYIFMGTSSNFGNMISAAIASFFLPFLPMLPVQILLTNTLYDMSQIAIPTDAVDDAELHRPRHWDIGLVKRFMLTFGPISSLYDILTFVVLVVGLHATASVFQTGWFMESIITQTLVVFVFRTKKVPFFTSRPSVWLLFSALAIVGIGLYIPYSFLAETFYFTPLKGYLVATFIVMALAYLMLIDVVKAKFYNRNHIGA